MPCLAWTRRLSPSRRPACCCSHSATVCCCFLAVQSSPDVLLPLQKLQETIDEQEGVKVFGLSRTIE